MSGSLAPPVRADVRPQINVPMPPRGLTVYRSVQDECISFGPAHAWLDGAIGGLKPGMVIAVIGDLDLGSMLATQIAVGLGAGQHRSLVFAMGIAPLSIVARARTLTADWSAEDARAAITSIELTPEAHDLRDLRAIIDMSIDPRYGANRGVASVMVDRAILGRRSKIAARAAEDFAACTRSAGNVGAAFIALLGGHADAIEPLLAYADCVLELTAKGRRRCKLSVRSSDAPAGSDILLEYDNPSGELRPVKDEAPFIGRARTWVGGDDPIAEIHAIVSPAAGRRPRIIANGLSDRRVEQALTLIDRLPFIDFKAQDHDVEALLTGDTYFHSGFCLPLVAAIASSIIRRAVPDDVVLTGEVGLDRRVRGVSAAWAESIAAAAAAGQIKETTRLLIAPNTARRLDGMKCQPIAAPTLDAALLQLWPDLH